MKKIEEAQEKIESALFDCQSIDEAENALKELGSVRFVDEKIDDGLEDCEDEYLILRCFDVTVDEIDFYVKLYYGNNSGKLGTFNVSED